MVISICKWLLAGFLLLPHGESHAKNESKHPFYVTVTEINYNAKDKTLELSCKIFTNDFESVLEKYSGTKIDLSDPKDKSTSDRAITGYIVKHLQVNLDNHPVELQFVGSEKESDGTWSYFQAINLNPFKKIDITNSLLYESFDNEINLMHVVVNGNRQSKRVSNPESAFGV